MLKKYKLSVKSFNKNDHYGRNYDITVGKQELKNIEASHSHYCGDCEYSSKCPYYFDEYQNYSPHTYCLADYTWLGSALLNCIGFLSIIGISHFIKYEIGIPIIIIIFIAICIIKKIITPIGNYIEGISLTREINEEKKKKSIIENNLLKASPSSLYLEKISKAKEEVAIVQNLFQSNDFKSCNNSIQECIKLLEKIIKILEDNNSVYPRVSSLFEIVLPEVYNVLINFLELDTTDCINSEIEKTLNSTLSKFLKYMEKVKKEALLNSSEDIAKINFEASNDFICTWLDLK